MAALDGAAEAEDNVQAVDQEENVHSEGPKQWRVLLRTQVEPVDG